MDRRSWLQRHFLLAGMLAFWMSVVLVAFGSLEVASRFLEGLPVVIYDLLNKSISGDELILTLIGTCMLLAVFIYGLKVKALNWYSIFNALWPFVGWFVLIRKTGGLDGREQEARSLKQRIIRFEWNVKQLSLFDENSKKDQYEINGYFTTNYEQDVRELADLRLRFPYVIADGSKPRIRWKLKVAVNIVGLIATVIFMIIAANYQLPILEEINDYQYSAVIKDYSQAPLWVRIGSQHSTIPLYAGISFLFGIFTVFEDSSVGFTPQRDMA